MKSVVVDPDVYDWEGDAPLRRPFTTTVIYEMHVAGFTRHPNSDVAPEQRGTYAGMIEQQEVHPARLPRIHAEIDTVAENVGTQRKALTRIRYGCGWTDSYGRALVRGFGFCDIRRRLFEACAQRRRRGTLAGGASNADVVLWHWHHG